MQSQPRADTNARRPNAAEDRRRDNSPRVWKGPPPLSAAWSALVRRIERETQGGGRGSSRLLAFAGCQRFCFVRESRCGARSPLTRGWCGHRYCVACAARRADAVVASLEELVTDRRLWVVDLRVPAANGYVLPPPGTIASRLRTWRTLTEAVARLTATVPLDPSPPRVLTPDGLVLLVRPTAEDESDERLQLLGMQQEAHGLDVRTGVTTRELALARLKGALLLESKRFSAAVESSQSSHGVLAGAARTRSRRPRVRGLEAPVDRGTGNKGCTEHGPNCRTKELVVIDRLNGDRVVWRGRGCSLEGATRRQVLSLLLRADLRAPVEARAPKAA